MPYTPFAGTAGRVAVGSGNTPVAGVLSWKIDKQVEVVQSTNFESAADANGVVWETYVGGIGKYTGSLEGIFDGNIISSEDVLAIGTNVTLDLLFDKTSLAGYANVTAIITGFSPSQSLREIGKFSATFTGTGVPPAA